MRLEIKNGKVKAVTTGALPCQIIFCLKERNQKKVNSHRWALQAFGRILDPKICLFMDVSTEPGPASIYHIWRSFNQHPTCGGVSAFTKVLHGQRQNLMTDPILAAQNFEYRTWNALDRPFDSLLGLRFDMPAAMFAYRFVALQNDKFGKGPLNEYFRAERSNAAEDGLLSANMALTEERALSFALVTKRHCNWDLRYVHEAIATIDVPERSAEYVAQRQRWINGSFFGSVYAITHVWQIFRTEHSASRKALLFLQCLYQSFALTFTWFSIVSGNSQT
jgi:chitin synthase